MILQLSTVDWSDLLRGDYVNECVRKFYDAIYDCFELFVPKYIVKYGTVKYPWFDRELHNGDNNKTKAHKYLKGFETLHVRSMSESDQCLYDTAFRRFRELRRDFKSLHRLKYAQYIVRIEGGLKNNPQEFFKYADIKRDKKT
jgi:hypothetical protein